MDVRLEKYEGPLDLLLRLIQRAEINIYDIPISQITAEYMAVIATLPPDMEQMSEFLVMAATLLEIKSKMLLPRPKPENDEPEEDPREALTRQLVAYQHAQELAEQLSVLTPVGERLTSEGDKEALQILTGSRHANPLDELIPATQLAEIFADIMRRAAEKIDTVRAGYGEMQKEKFTITEKVSFMRKMLHQQGRLRLSALFTNCVSRHEMIVTFLALLEMVRRGMVCATQQTNFGDVELLPSTAGTA
ncbi:MAG: segregation/condensation protein A [Defluviitaleaceae bacterium]|nr:segregation/condensation protein A [Defluviitaleaceae bacterium]MCL2263764.1 segregation/condensation protein A [Defluviitaleaceae bacterium]